MDRSYHVGGVRTPSERRDHAGGEDRSSLIAFHQSFVTLITVLAIVLGIHFQTQKSSPVETHLAMILTLIMAAVVYSIVLARINVQPRSSEYLTLFRLAYLGSGILICDLLSRDWLQKKFEAVRLAASEAFSLTRDTEEQQNGGNRLPV
uniref:Uncharacterized protein n=1 Tax=Quercus lobata TaxID=97700 RepID=A0A7N2LFX1_QUELO